MTLLLRRSEGRGGGGVTTSPVCGCIPLLFYFEVPRPSSVGRQKAVIPPSLAQGSFVRGVFMNSTLGSRRPSSLEWKGWSGFNFFPSRPSPRSSGTTLDESPVRPATRPSAGDLPSVSGRSTLARFLGREACSSGSGGSAPPSPGAPDLEASPGSSSTYLSYAERRPGLRPGSPLRSGTTGDRWPRPLCSALRLREPLPLPGGSLHALLLDRFDL